MGSNEVSDSNTDTENNQYLDIYKLHFDNMNEMSNRRVNVNRYYILALSVIILALTALLRSGGLLSVVFAGSSEKVNLSPKVMALSMCLIGILGAMLSESWLRNILGYLDTTSNRYEVIKELECKLKYDFIKKSYDRMHQDAELYFPLAFHELHAPFIFQLGFTILIVIGIYPLVENKIGYILSVCIIIFGIIAVSVRRIQSLQSKLKGGNQCSIETI